MAPNAGVNDIDEKTKNSGTKGSAANFEDLLDRVGTFGPWNVTVFLLCFISSGTFAFQSVTYEFLGATPDHWCKVDSLLEVNWTQQQILNFAIPRGENGEHETCNMYDHNYTLAADLGYEAAMEYIGQRNESAGIISCYSRDFNRSQYESTLATEFDLVCERRLLYSTTQSASQFGILIGSLIVGSLNDLIGRRLTSVFSSVTVLLTGLIASASPNLEMYIVMKLLVSTASFITYASCFVIVMEVCSQRQRSSVGSLVLIPWAVGYMISPGIAYFIRPWRWLQIAYTTPATILLSYIWLLPESPRWLISKGRFEEALKILSWAAKWNKKTLPPEEDLLKTMKNISKSREETTQENNGNIREKVKNIFIFVIKPEFRLRAFVCGICWFTVSMTYYGIALGSSNLSADPYLYNFLGGLIELPSYILMWPAMAYLGRRWSVIGSFLFCGVCIAIISVLLVLLEEVPVGLLMFLSLSGKFAITATFHTIFIYTSELFPTQYRSLAIGQGSTLARFGSMASPYINDLLGAMVSWSPSALFTALSIVAAGLALILPETKDCIMDEESTVAASRVQGHKETQKHKHQSSL